MGIYKKHTKEIYIKSQVFDYYDNLIKPKKLETKNIEIDEKSYSDLVKHSLNSTIKAIVSYVNIRISEQFGLYEDFETVCKFLVFFKLRVLKQFE